MTKVVASKRGVSRRGRSKDWNESLAEDLRNLDLAREFLLAIIEENISIQEALGKVAKAYGIKEFSRLVKLPSSNVSRAINPKSNITQQTLTTLLEPFGLKLTVAIKNQSPLPAIAQTTLDKMVR